MFQSINNNQHHKVNKYMYSHLQRNYLGISTYIIYQLSRTNPIYTLYNYSVLHKNIQDSTYNTEGMLFNYYFHIFQEDILQYINFHASKNLSYNSCKM